MTSLADLFDAAGVSAAFHAVDLTTGRDVAHRADEASVSASVFKLPVLLELCRQHDEGELDAAALVEVPVVGRAPGPFGLSVMQDATHMSLRDLAWLMIGVSDNAATDVVCEHVGLTAVGSTLARLGLHATRVEGDCRDLFGTLAEDLDGEDLLQAPLDALARTRALDPARTLHATTPRDTTSLLRHVWQDTAAGAGACAETRRILGLQVWPHRLASGFADLQGVTTSGKTGTLPTVRNEVGVVEYPDGGRYAVAVFTTSRTADAKNAAADAVIGRAARLAVDLLRAA